MTQSKKIFRSIIYFFIIIISSAFFIGLIYLFYKTAVTDKHLYTILFLVLIFSYIFYKIIRLILDKKGIILLYGVIKFFSYTIIIFILFLIIILPIALILRDVVLGIITESVALLILFFCFVKIKPFSLIKNLTLIK